MIQKLCKALETGKLEVDGNRDLWETMVNTALDFPEKPKDFKVEVTFPENQYEHVVLVSGGQDSTVCYKIATSESDSVKALYFDLGQKYVEQEMNALSRLGIPVQFESIKEYDMKTWKHVVPFRNLILLLKAEEYVKEGGTIWLGAVSGEGSENAGDKSELFFRLFEEHILTSKMKNITIRTLKHRTKNDWMKWWIETFGNEEILNAVSCFQNFEKPCGACQACFRKWIAMRYCGIKDAEGYFMQNPFEAKEYVEKYKRNLGEALEKKDFTHYTEIRCVQDLGVINDYEVLLRGGRGQ